MQAFQSNKLSNAMLQQITMNQEILSKDKDSRKKSRRCANYLDRGICKHGLLASAEVTECIDCFLKYVYPQYTARIAKNRAQAALDLSRYAGSDEVFTHYVPFKYQGWIPQDDLIWRDDVTSMRYAMIPMTLCSRSTARLMVSMFLDGTDSFKNFVCGGNERLRRHFEAMTEADLKKEVMSLRPENVTRKLRKFLFTEKAVARRDACYDEMIDFDDVDEDFQIGYANIVSKYGNSKRCAEPDCPREKKKYGLLCKPHSIIRRYSNPSGEAELGEEYAGQWLKDVLDKAGPIKHEIPAFAAILTSMQDMKDTIYAKLDAREQKKIDWKRLGLAALACGITVYRCWGDKIAVGAAVAAFIISIDLALDIKAQVLEHVMKYLTRPTNIQIDADSILGLIGAVGPVICVILSAVVLGQIPKGSDWSNFIATYSRMGAAVKSTETIYEKGQELTNTTMNFIRKHIFKMDVYDNWTDVNTWCSEVSKIMNTDFETNIRGNHELKNSIDSLLIRGNNILKMLDDLKIPIAQRSRVQSCMMFLQSARAAAATGGCGNIEPRVAPVIFHFVGASGTGKSTMLWPLMSELLVEMGCTDPDDIRTKTYFKTPSKDGRWDGYPNHAQIVVCDDVFSQKDTPANPSQEALETIRMSNTAMYQLQMAELKDKGTTFFKAPVVIWTSNQHNFTFESLTNPEAISRRITARYRQKPHPHFSRKQMQAGVYVDVLDQVKVAEYLAVNPDNLTKVMLFDREETNLIGDPKVIRRDMTFEEMAAECVVMNKVNMENFGRFNSGVNSYMQKCIERRNARIATASEGAPGPSGTPQIDINPLDDPEIRKMFGDTFKKSREERGEEPDADFETPPPPEIFYFRRGWFDALQRINHLNVMDSVLATLTAGTVNSLEPIRPPSPYDLTYIVNGEAIHLLDMPCVQIDRRWEERFIYAWSRAACAIEAFEPANFHNLTPEGRARFDSVFSYHFGQRPRLTHCAEHKAGEHTWEGLFTHWRRHFARFAREPTFLDKLSKTFDDIHEEKCYLKWIVMLISTLALALYVFLIWAAFKCANKAIEFVVDTTKTVLSKGIRCVKSFFKSSNTFEDVIHAYELDDDVQSLKKLVEENPTDYDRPPLKKMKEILGDATDWKTNIDENMRVYRSFYAESKDTNVKGRTTNNVESKDTNVAGRKTNNVEADPEVGVFDEYVRGKDTRMNNLLRRISLKVGYYGSLEILDTFLGFVGTVEAVTDQNADELGPIAIKNLYKLEYYDGVEWRRAMNLLFIKGRLAITNKHVTIKRNSTQWRITGYSNIQYHFNLWNCRSACFNDTEGDDFMKDIMLFELPKFVHQHVNICSKFMTNADFSRFSSLSQACLFTYEKANMNLKYMFTNTIDSFDNNFRLLSNGVTIGSIRRYFMYGIQTGPGDCGGLLCAYDQNFSRKLIGIHAAGSTDTKYQGVGQPVSQETLEKLLSRIDIKEEASLMSPDLDSLIKNQTKVAIVNGLVQAGVESNFTHYGEAHTPIHHSKKTNIHRSPLNGVLCEPTMKPAYLRPILVDGEIVDPMKKARSKAAQQTLEPEEIMSDASVYDYMQLIDFNVDENHRRVFSLEEAIKGIEGDEYIDGVNRRTSPGYGLKPVGPGKTKWLGTDDYIVDDPYVLKAHKEMLDICKSGERPSVVWVDTLKDERRPIAKVDEGKTRLFSVGQMVYTLLFRQYFLGFTAHMMRNRIDFESCIGTNVYNRDWTRIADKLKQLGKKVLAGDFSNYDGSMNATWLWDVLEVIEYFYKGTDEEKTIRRALWSEVTNSIHIYEDTLYGWTHSNPSGCPITAILNSVYHSISARYVYLWCARKYSPQHASLAFFYKFVRHVNYGDDDGWNVADAIADWFNQETITEAYATVGMTYTDEAKTGIIVKYRTLDEIQFLKREFRWDQDQMRYRAPLSLVTIYEMPQWVRGTVDVKELTATTLLEAVHELAQHSREVFMEHIPKFENARRQLGMNSVIFHTYDHYQEIEYTKWCEQYFTASRPTGLTPTTVETADNRSVEFMANGCPKITETALTNLGVVCQGKVQMNEVFASTPEMETQTQTQIQTPKCLKKELREVMWNRLKQEEEDLSNWRSVLNREMQASKCENIRFMQEREAEKKREIGRYKVVLNEYFQRPDSGEIQMDETPSDTVESSGNRSDSQLTANREEVKTVELMRFDDDGGVATDNNTPENEPQGYDTTGDLLENSVRNILQRPMIMSQGTWTAAQTFGTGIVGVTLPRDWFNKPQVQKKLEGFRFMRGDFRVTLQVNAQPFNQGVVIMTFFPFNDQLSVPVPINPPPTAMTGYRHVYLDLSVATSCEMVVPFICTDSHFDLFRVGGLLGTVRAFVYSPLAGGTNDVEFTLYVNAENVSVEMPGPYGIRNVAKSSSTNWDDMQYSGEVQINTQKEKKQGTISGIAKAVSGVANVFTGVPTLAPVATAVGWAADMVAGVASVFGFSKPTDDRITGAMQQLYVKTMANADGESKPKTMGLNSQNQVTIPTGHFQTTEDEMSLAHILSQPIFYDKFDMTAAQAPGAILWQIPVKPQQTQIIPGPGFIGCLNDYLSYLSLFFSFWRGAICYHFRIVKTAFHAARVRLYYIPYGVDFSALTAEQKEMCYSMIIDIRDRTDFSFDVPFVNNVPWLPCRQRASEMASINPKGTHGKIVVEVLNALRAPATVADHIEFIVERSAGPDFQFACPSLRNDVLFEQPAIKERLSGEVQINDDECVPLFKTKGMSPLDVHTSTMGEVITSLRQLLKRYALMKAVVGTGVLRVDPVSMSGNAPNYFDFVTRLFRFYSGSMRVLSVINDPPETNSDKPAQIFLAYPRGDIEVGLVPEPNTSNIFQLPHREHAMEIEVPYYGVTPASLSYLGNPLTTPIPNTDFDKVTNPISRVELCFVTDHNHTLYRQIGEDFSFGYLVAPPITFLTTPP